MNRLGDFPEERLARWRALPETQAFLADLEEERGRTLEACAAAAASGAPTAPGKGGEAAGLRRAALIVKTQGRKTEP